MPTGKYKRVKKINYPKNRDSPKCSDKKRKKIMDSINKYNKEHPERYIEATIKMRNTLKGGYSTGRLKPNKGTFQKGYKHTEEWKKQNSERMRGENHPNWQGGISNNPYPDGWNNMLKESIRQRDNYMCQECGIIQEEFKKALQVHHIDCDKDNLNPNNLTSLCNSCHRILHWQLRREE